VSQAERRRLLRQQRRRETLRQCWRIVVFTAAALGLGYALLRHGWVIAAADQVEVTGSRQVQRDQLIQAADLRFPLPLLTLRPNDLSRRLSSTLPVEQVQVQRLMAPARLRVQLVDRKAVARAERRGPLGLEQGYVDQLGNWMSARQASGALLNPTEPGPMLSVRGWQPSIRPVLAQLLSRRRQFGGALQTIRFEAGGSLWLDTSTLGPVRFGPADERLSRRIDVLEHLLKDLPGRIKGRRLQAIDLSDPEQPELNLPAPLKPAAQVSANP
jgi:cell division protein FtsQ